ncbi:MAG: Alkaline phosphatase [uncultured Solirubrobacteraceae bacterium]|uniref:Alkaline phosphatase n=1 Tax=uncultured Solirubrobacteraceae bacterium TaxID=1162706 RepID=A0A6J4T0F6_9ACTN|nr:MAG: Alkaline phosphatase [uncultured Solirubrobacteraceae bacterium]
MVMAAPAASAGAASIRLTAECDRSGCFDYTVVLEARRGERNAITVTGSSKLMRIRDSGAPLSAGPDCERVDAHEVVCPRSDNPGYRLDARLGDLDDVFDASVLLASLRLDGGPGDDRLTGGPNGDVIGGGGGRDLLFGGDGDDRLGDGDGNAGVDDDALDGGPGDDQADYGDRFAGVRVDLADDLPDGEPGESDRLIGIEGVDGGFGDDALAGGDGPGTISGGPGRDAIAARGGDDVVDAEAHDRVDLGEGDDRVLLPRTVVGVPRGRGILRCGPGNDDIAYYGDGWTMEACERLRLGDTYTRLRPIFTGGVALRFVDVGCQMNSRGNCRVRVRASDAAGRVLASGTPQRRAFRSRNVTVRLTEAGRRVVARARRTSVVVELRAREDGRERRRSVRILLSPEPGRPPG